MSNGCVVPVGIVFVAMTPPGPATPTEIVLKFAERISGAFPKLRGFQTFCKNALIGSVAEKVHAQIVSEFDAKMQKALLPGVAADAKLALIEKWTGDLARPAFDAYLDKRTSAFYEVRISYTAEPSRAPTPAYAHTGP